jgi:hypothetical protein
MTKKIVIFYVPGSFGSFLSWMIDRFNTVRKNHEPKIIDNPLQEDGSSHGYASLCKIENIDQVKTFLKSNSSSAWGYDIWAGWPVTKDKNLDQCISETLGSMSNDDRLIVVTRFSDFEAGVSWINASKKLDQKRWFDSLKISGVNQLQERLNEELNQRHFLKVNDLRFIEISINELLFAQPSRILSTLNLLGFDICDESLFTEVLEEKRKMQHSVALMNDILSGNLIKHDNHAVTSVINLIKEKQK